MKFDIIVQPSAAEEIEAAFLYLAAEVSLEAAERWFNDLDDAIATLGRMPRRCPLAPEDTFFADEIRQLLIAPYRVLFTIRERRVYVLHVRHMARRTLQTEEDT